MTRSGGIHHCTYVVHPRLKRHQVSNMVGKPRPAFVEEQYARETRQLAHSLYELRSLPRRQHVIDAAPDPHDITRGIADHLYCDRDATAPRILHVRH